MISARVHIVVLLMVWAGFAKGQTQQSATFEPSSETAQRAYFLAQNHLVKGDLEQAYSAFQTCVDEEPDVSGFHFELGKIELELGRYESSLKHLNEAIELEPTNDWYHYYRGQTNLTLENYDDAWADLMVWAKKRPGNIESLDLVAELFLVSGELWHAYQAYSFYEDEIAKNLEVRLKRMMLVMNSQLNDRQIVEFINDAIRDFPEEPLFVFERAGLHASNGDFSKAIPIYEALINSNPEFLESYISLAKCHVASESGTDIYPFLEKGFKSVDIDSGDKMSLLLSINDDAQIDNLLLIALDAHPEDPRLNHFIAMRHVSFGRFEDGLSSYEKVVQQNPSSIEVREEYLFLLYKLKDWEELVKVSKEALTYFPLEPVFNYYQGIAHTQLDENKNAVRAFKEGLAIVFDNPELGGILASNLAMSYRELGELEKSYSAFEESLEYVEDPYVMNNYAYFLATDRVDIQRALELSTKANNAVLEANFLDTHALVLFLLNRNEDALEMIRQAQALLPVESGTDAVFSEREGDILWELNDFDGAKAKWNEAIEAGGGKKRLNEKLSRTIP